MQLSSHFLFQFASCSKQPDSISQTVQKTRRFLMVGSLFAAAIAAGFAAPAMATPDDTLYIAQALPTPVPPTSYASSGETFPGEQYLVLVNGNSDLLLSQVQQVEPDAFINFVEGVSVIQAGRFTSLQNAQLRASELASLGIGARVQSVAPASAAIPVTAAADYGTTVSQFPGDLPPLPVAASPSAIEFGQASPFDTTASPATTYPPATATDPSLVTPPPASRTPQPVQTATPSGYYVIIPGGAADLTGIASQIVNLGAPASLVRTRLAPRGPHVAVGPYNERGIAEEWSVYLRDYGLGARVHFE